LRRWIFTESGVAPAFWRNATYNPPLSSEHMLEKPPPGVGKSKVKTALVTTGLPAFAQAAKAGLGMSRSRASVARTSKGRMGPPWVEVGSTYGVAGMRRNVTRHREEAGGRVRRHADVWHH